MNKNKENGVLFLKIWRAFFQIPLIRLNFP